MPRPFFLFFDSGAAKVWPITELVNNDDKLSALIKLRRSMLISQYGWLDHLWQVSLSVSSPRFLLAPYFLYVPQPAYALRWGSVIGRQRQNRGHDMNVVVGRQDVDGKASRLGMGIVWFGTRGNGVCTVCLFFLLT